MIGIRDTSFYLHSNKLPIISGSFHYWRNETSLWSCIFDKIKGMGFRIVDSYFPWSVHEIKREKFDFTGNKDVDYFLSLCEEKGLYLLARPGPHINAEITYFGYPKRIFKDSNILSKDKDGNFVYIPAPPRMFPVPSYASAKFYEEVGIYFDAICEIFRKHLYPQGCIIAVQADNENSLFFRTAPYDHDYSSASIKLYQEFLRDKYKDINRISEAYKKKYKSFNEIIPPKKFDCKDKFSLPITLIFLNIRNII